MNDLAAEQRGIKNANAQAKLCAPEGRGINPKERLKNNSISHPVKFFNSSRLMSNTFE